MSIEVGTIIRVTTKTKDDLFGECFYEVIEVGLPAPEKGRENEMDGVKAEMLGGTGKSARPGLVVRDSVWRIEQDIAEGRTHLVPREEKISIMRRFGNVNRDN